jgi:hypothetical protein
MTKKLSAVDRQRVSNALTKCAAATKDIESNKELADKAYQILSKELGDNPGLFKAACQVYNSCKSIHKLAAANDDNRGNSFSILNVQDMSSRLNAEKVARIRKAASAPVVFGKVERPENTAPMQKAASANKAVKAEFEVPAFDVADYRQYVISELQDAENFVLKTASAVQRASDLRDGLLERFISAMATESKELRKDAAARLVANYGEDAEKLISAFGAARPLQKLASADYRNKFKGTPSLQHGRTSELATQLIEAEKSLRDAIYTHSIALEKTAGMVMDHARAYMGIKKAAAADKLITTALKADIIKDFAENIGIDELDKNKVAKDVIDNKFINRMIAHSHRRAFMRALQNPAIAKYPLDKALAAFNATIPKLPISQRNVPATAHQSLIESQMMNALATGSVPSKADTEIITTLANTIGKLNPDVVVIGGDKDK